MKYNSSNCLIPVDSMIRKSTQVNNKKKRKRPNYNTGLQSEVTKKQQDTAKIGGGENDSSSMWRKV